MSHILFLSDFHLGVPDAATSKEREVKICALIDLYKDNLSEIFLIGDVFDFWMEYKTCVPKGFYRLFGKLAELADRNIPIHYFTGNHDMWMQDLFSTEFNAIIHRKPITIDRQGKKIFIAHGDGLGPGDTTYKLLKVFFASPICQFLFRWIHPDIGIKLASFFSYQSRYGSNIIQEQYHGNAKRIFRLFHFWTSAFAYLYLCRIYGCGVYQSWRLARFQHLWAHDGWANITLTI